MRMNSYTKNKMRKQRLKRISDYFKAHHKGSIIYIYGTNSDVKKYFVLDKYELHQAYYFVVSDEQGEIIITKIVYNGCPEIIGISKESKRYIENKQRFKSWIEKAKIEREKEIRQRYMLLSEINTREKTATKLHPTKITFHTNHINAGKVEVGSLELQKENNGNYYLVIKFRRTYIIAKVMWYDGYVQAKEVPLEEYEKNEDMFVVWIEEAMNKEED